MRVLAIDSSGMTASVAVVEDDRTVAEYTMDYKKTHSQTLLPMIDEMSKMIELDLNSIDAIAVAGGPGSFTGLRIGSATAKGLGLALNKPLINVPTVDALAYEIYGCEDIICPIMDARRKQVYTGIYSFSKKAGEVECSKEVDPVFQVIRMQMAVGIEELIERLNGYGKRVVFLGDGVPVHKEAIANGMKVPYSFAPSYMNRQRAAAVGALGIKLFKSGRYETAMEHQPDYLRASQAEREHAEKEKNSPLEIRKLVVEDAAAIAEMERIIFLDAWSEKSILETIELSNTICLVAEKAGRKAGYVLAYDLNGEAEIVRIATDKDRRRQGVGTFLLEELKKECTKLDITKVMLDVRASNDAARKLYEKEGFVQDGTRPGFYKNPDEDAILMSAEL